MHVGDQFTSATSWAGGIADDAGPGASDRGCTQQPMASYRGTYPPNTGLYLGSSRATRVSWAIALSFMNLGGTSGYSTNMDMGWRSKRGNGLWLCGVTGDEATNPGIVQAQNIP